MPLPIENKRVNEVIKIKCNDNQLQFSNQIGISQPRINRLFSKDSRNNKYPLVSFEIIQAIINKFIDIDANWLITGHGGMLKPKDPLIVTSNTKGIPLIPIDAIAGYGTGEMQIMDYDTERYVVPEFSELNVDYMIRVKGSSMYPKYNSGDLVACKKLPLDTFFQWNKVYVLDTIQGPMIKRIHQSNHKNAILCVSDNDKYKPFDLRVSELNSLAIVVGVIRME